MQLSGIINKFKEKCCDCSRLFSHFAPFLARLSIGFVFAQAGWGKLHNLDRTIGFFQSLGVPLASVQAPFVACVELAGGVLLFLGIGTRFVALPLMVVMLVAMLTAHKDSLGSLDDLTGLAPFLYFIILMFLAATGGGCLSLGRFFCRKHTQACADKIGCN